MKEWKEEYCKAYDLDHIYVEREDGSKYCLLCKREEGGHND